MSALRTVRPAARSLLYSTTRTMSASTRLNAEGSTGSGASRAGGAAQGDAFTKREQASEDKFVKDQEREKLQILRQKIAQQKAHLDDLEKHVQGLSENNK